MCVCLWELNFRFYALWPGCNTANIAVKGELDGRGGQFIAGYANPPCNQFKGFSFQMRTDVCITYGHYLFNE